MTRRAKPQIYSLGYQLRRLPEFVAQLLDAGVQVVVDVRETAWSHKPGFSKSQLERALGAEGITYLHAPFAGNPKELRRSAKSHHDCLRLFRSHLGENPEVISRLGELLDELAGAAVCLICYERHPEDCHRGILIEELLDQAEVDLEVEHLGVGGAPRLS